MHRCLAVCLALLLTTEVSYGGFPDALKDRSPCGDWLQYGDEKCIKIAHRAGTQTQKNGDTVCDAYSEELNTKTSLITVKTKEEQLFLQHFLFAENNVIDDVWLGLEESEIPSEYEWKDGGKVKYSNWATQSVNDGDHHCVAMASGKGTNAAGLWVKVHCEKRLVVACERIQPWSLETIQKLVLKQKEELEEQKNIWEKKVSDLEEKNVRFQKTIHDLEAKYDAALAQKAGNMPIGFIYIQYPNQATPADLWPFLHWKDISSSYAGLFFRVMGGNATAFGQVQEENDKALADVEHMTTGQGQGGVQPVPSDGTWSKDLLTGWSSGKPPYRSLRFRLTNGEVRPRNKAVIVWQRVQ